MTREEVWVWLLCGMGVTAPIDVNDASTIVAETNCITFCRNGRDRSLPLDLCSVSAGWAQIYTTPSLINKAQQKVSGEYVKGGFIGRLLLAPRQILIRVNRINVIHLPVTWFPLVRNSITYPIVNLSRKSITVVVSEWSAPYTRTFWYELQQQ
jgi:hypothetical protein